MVAKQIAIAANQNANKKANEEDVNEPMNSDDKVKELTASEKSDDQNAQQNEEGKEAIERMKKMVSTVQIDLTGEQQRVKDSY